MMWNYEGMEVTGVYMDTFHVVGRVELSRVAYGGRVKHTVVLERPIDVFGAVRDRVILDHEVVTRVRDLTLNLSR